jgi:hypothetical protein
MGVNQLPRSRWAERMVPSRCIPRRFTRRMPLSLPTHDPPTPVRLPQPVSDVPPSRLAGGPGADHAQCRPLHSREQVITVTDRRQ